MLSMTRSCSRKDVLSDHSFYTYRGLKRYTRIYVGGMDAGEPKLD